MNVTEDSINDFNVNETANLNNSTIVNPDIGDSLRILQHNIERISKWKCEYLEKLLFSENIDVARIQEPDSRRDALWGDGFYDRHI